MNGNEKLYQRIMSLSDRETWEKSGRISARGISDIIREVNLGMIDHVYLVGHGSSLADAYVGEAWFEHIAKISAKAIPAFCFRNYVDPKILKGERELVIGVTAFGTTKSVEESLKFAREHGALTISISGEGDLPCHMAAHYAVETDSRNESVGRARTTSFSQLLLALYLLAVEIGNVTDPDNKKDKAYWMGQLELLYGALGALPGISEEIEEKAAVMHEIGAQNVFVLGTGPNRGIMEEGALKITEFAWILGEGEETEEFAHGRFREVDEKTPMFIIAPNGTSSSKVLDILSGTAKAKTPTIVLTDVVSEPLGKLASHIIRMPGGLDEYVTPLLYVIPFWLYGYFMGLKLGVEVGTPRHDVRAKDIDFAAHYDPTGEPLA